MKAKFELNRDQAVLNFSQEYCQSDVELLESTGFQTVLQNYISRMFTKQTSLYVYFQNNGYVSEEEILIDLTNIFKLTLVLKLEEIIGNYPKYEGYFTSQEKFLEFIERFYSFWRRMVRYAIAYNKEAQHGMQNVQFIEAHSRFANLVLKTYRQVSETIMGKKNRVYRQLIAGVNAGIISQAIKYPLNKKEYKELEDIPVIESVILYPPFITYPKRNTRKGIFQEVYENPLKDKVLDSEEFFCFPAKVGKLFALVYFHKDFMAQGITLCNLFELADIEETKNRKPDLIYAYGVKDEEEKTVFYQDKENSLYVGYASYSENIDYFGYMKKMILTIHNVTVIDQNQLPLHGAMANIIMKNGKTKNIIIIGDSGAGKSETLEALRVVGDEYIKDIKVVFDDMGVLIEGNKAHGTEIGAFVRLDDLDTGYAYKEIDRSIFMNPDKINARIVIPIATYEEITTDYPIDLFLYANNYDEGDIIDFFEDKNKAQDVFTKGARMAKGTTSEIGLVESYFANPFGPVQRQKQTDILLNSYFTSLFEKNVKVGQIRTKLGLTGFEQKGPKEAALKLLEYLTNNE